MSLDHFKVTISAQSVSLVSALPVHFLSQFCQVVGWRPVVVLGDPFVLGCLVVHVFGLASRNVLGRLVVLVFGSRLVCFCQHLILVLGRLEDLVLGCLEGHVLDCLPLASGWAAGLQ